MATRRALVALKPRALASLSNRVKPVPATPRKSGSTGVKEREDIRKRDGYLCQNCKRNGIVRAGRDVDHIQDLAFGGSDSPANKELLCGECHGEKTAETERLRRLAAPRVSR